VPTSMPQEPHPASSILVFIVPGSKHTAANGSAPLRSTSDAVSI
jgi:hypothetical protein